MPIDRSSLDDAIASAKRFATQGAPEALAQLGAELGLDVAQLGSGSGVGELDAVMLVLMLPTAEVARLVPLGLQLAPNPLSPVGKHPVLVQLSHWRFEFGSMDYHEVMLAVPYVEISSYDAPRRGPFLYMPRLYLDDELPRRLGVYLYGYEKEAAAIECRFPQGSEPGHYRVSAESNGAPLLAATITPAGTRGQPGSFANFAELRQLLEMPTISQAARIWDHDAARSHELSPFFASNLVYQLDDAAAALEPVSVQLTISPGFTPHGLAGSYTAPSLEQATLGAFRTQVKVAVALPVAPAKLRYPVPTPTKKQKVVVLGGGAAACAAAYWLARQPDRYEVHMYTQGFRLGGKCAAGRNANANMRIEEHGLHAFLGFYENAFRTVRSVYQTAGLPIDDGGSLRGAFEGSNHNGLMIDLDGQWKYFRTPLGLNDRVPGRVPAQAEHDDGQDLSIAARGSVSGMGELMVEAFRHVARQTTGMERRNVAVSRHLDDSVHAPEHQGLLMGLVTRVRDRVREVREDIADSLRWNPAELVRQIANFLEDKAELEIARWLAEGVEGPLAPVHKFCRLVIRILDEYVERRGDDDEVWYRWMTLSTTLTAIAGLIEDRVTHLAELDGEDMWAWFRRHRLDPRLLPEPLREQPVEGGQKQGSPVIAGVYETLFAHGAHEASPRELAAGVGLRWMFLTAFGYAGFAAYEFKYSAPQTLFTPYYEALTRALGVKIHFFHRTTELVVEGTGDERRLVGVKLQRQATVAAGSAAYDPYERNPPSSNPPNQPPWPIVPNYNQLEEGEQLRAEKVNLESPYSPWPGVGEVELRQGEDFDLCILGITLGALPPLTRALWASTSPSHDPRWTTMLEDIAVTQTLSMQLWFTVPESQLYAVGDDVDGNTGEGRGLLTGFVEPEPSMGDLTQLLRWEGWGTGGGDVPKFLAYHTGSLTAVSAMSFPPFSDHEYPERREAWWRAEARAWLQAHYAKFYDRAPPTWTGFLATLARPAGAAANADGLDLQYFNAAPQPSDHYVLAQPKGMPARMGQLESGVAGLFLCGDWTRTDLNCGCVEAATQSGMLCARGISGHPVYVWHPGF